MKLNKALLAAGVALAVWPCFGGSNADTTKPTVSIVKPLVNARLNSATCMVIGKTTDNIKVTNVWYQLNAASWTTASTTNGWMNWTADLNLTPGTNVLRFCAVDSNGNWSLTNKASFFYVVKTPMDVSINGRGTLLPNYNGALLEIGKTYSMTASPAAKFAFSGWTSSLTSTNRKLTFLMSSNLSLAATFTDVAPPTLTFTYPRAATRVNTNIISVTGKASDNTGVTSVSCQLNTNGWITALSTNNWTNWIAAGLELTPGTNTFRAYATDARGNRSQTNTLKFIYVVSAPLTVGITGQGKVSPNYNGAVLEIGKTYTITATPAKGFSFTNWTGSLATNKAALTFLMTSNLSFTANFEDATRPVLVVNYPAVNQRITNGTTTGFGGSRDNVTVTSVSYQFNGGDWTPASTSNSWTNWNTAPLTLEAGTNILSARACDPSGRFSLTNTVKFIYTFNSALFTIEAVDSLPAKISENEGQPDPAIAFDGTNYLVAFRAYDNGGNPVPAAQLVSPSGVLGNQFRGVRASEVPKVAFDGTNYLLVWADRTANGSQPIYGQFLNRSANPIGIPFQISQSTTARTLGSLVYGSGKYLATWTDTRNATSQFPDSKNVYARLISPDGTLSGGEFQLTTTDASHTTAACDGTNFLTIWRDDSGNAGNVNGRFISPQGNFASDTFLIDTAPFDSSDNVILFDGHRYLVVINSYEHPDSDVSGLYGRFVKTDGEVSLDRLQLVSTNSSPKFPHAAFDGTNYFITWLEIGTAANLSKVTIKGRFFDTHGVMFGPERTVFAPQGNRLPLSTPVLFDGKKFFAASEYAAFVRFDLNENPIFNNGAIYGTFIARPSPSRDWAPQSLSGLESTVKAVGMPGSLSLTWGDSSWGQMGLPNGDPDDFCAGSYTYTKTGTNTAVVRSSDIGMLSHLNSFNEELVSIRFTSSSAGTLSFLSSDSSGTATMTLFRITNTVPSTIGGKTVRAYDLTGALMSTMNFASDGTFTEISSYGQPGEVDYGTYTFTQYSPTVAIVRCNYTDPRDAGVISFCEVKFSTPTSGSLFFSRYSNPASDMPGSFGSGTFTAQ